ncbi:MAG: hypothetical protein WED04_01225 [Promethearchaeati archaeon SRVP18_Atabeyarchaeia-1]
MAQGKLRQLELVDRPLKLLNGRLTIRMPAGAKLEARHENIMSAAESAEEESRVVLDAGDERLIVMAYELLRTASKDFERQVKKMVDTWEMGGARIEARESRGFLISPAKLDLHKTAVPVLSVVMNHEDGLVQLLGFFVNRKAGADAAGCVKLARSIAATIAPGDKVLNLKGGPREIGAFTALVPDGYALTAQPGLDFTVYRLQKVVPLGAPSSQLGVYIGDHPSYHHEREKVRFTKPKEQLLGADVEWHVWSAKKTMHHEVVVPYPSAGGRMLHIFLSSSSAPDIAEMHAIAESLRHK